MTPISTLSVPTLGALLLVVFLAIRSLYKYFSPSLPLPPGPPRDPIIGNLRQFPVEYQEKTFAKWAQQYGDVVYINILGKSIVILSSLKAARDLMEKRSANYSDRPRFVLLVELIGWDVLVHLPYGNRFRKHRRMIQEGFNANTIPGFRAVQEQEAAFFLDGMSKSPDAFAQHVRRFAAGSILKLAYGHTVKSIEDIFVRTADRAASRTVEAGSPGSMIVDLFPILKYLPTWMPGAGFKRNALSVRKDVELMLGMPFEMVKNNMRSGTAVPCLTSNLLDSQNLDRLDPKEEEDIKCVSGVLYAGAVDTTVAIILTFILAMVLHPEVFQKAQEEIDRVVGRDRLPNLDDRKSLPYLECVVKESYRWNSSVPLGIPHMAVEADTYRGYYIPKGTIMIPNIWAITQDPETYPSPQSFLPERFLGEKGAAIDPRNAVFGFGRRACPGQHFGDENVYLALAGILAAFTIGKALDDAGREITPVASFTSGFVSHPKPFPCVIKARSQKALDVVAEASADF